MQLNRIRVLLGFWILLAALPAHAAAQAQVPYRGEGSVSLDYGFFRSGDHLYSDGSIDGESSRGYVADGSRWFLGRTLHHAITVSVDYGVTSRMAATVDATAAFARYDGRAPVNLAVDDGDTHASLQDVGFQLRYQVLFRPVALVPFVGFGVPTRDYENNGHAAIGLGLSEWRGGVAVAGSLAPIDRRGYYHARLGLGVTESFRDSRLRRLHADLALGHVVGSRTSVRLTGSFLSTQGGEDWLESDELVHGAGEESLGTAFSESRYLRVGLGATRGLTSTLDVAADVVTTAWGENIEAGTHLLVRASWRFSTSRATILGRSGD